MEETIFINVDTQRDFIKKDGLLPIENAEEILPALKALTNFIKNNDMPVISTMDCHTPRDKELSNEPNFITSFPPHCMEQTDGFRLVMETEGLVDDRKKGLLFLKISSTFLKGAQAPREFSRDLKPNTRRRLSTVLLLMFVLISLLLAL